jgi:carnitine-CoA ligase
MTVPALGELLDRSAARHGDELWLRFAEDAYTFREAARRGDNAAAEFQRLGIEPGDRVVFVAGNSADLVFQWFGLNKVGGVFAPLNPRAPTSDVASAAVRAEPKLIVVGPGIAADPAELGQVAGAAVVSIEELSAGRRDPTSLPHVDPDSVAVFINTSGTTGLSKLVMQTHRTYVLTGESFPWWLGLDSSDRLMTALPLFHLNAQAYSTVGSLTAGAGLVLLDRFTASSFWEQARRFSATEVNMIGAMIEILTRQPESPADRDHSVRIVYTAPALPRERHLAVEARFGVRVVIGYAMSESPFGTIWPRDAEPVYGSMGTARQHPTLGAINEIRIVDDSGADLPPDETGEVLLRNPGIMQGYFRMPAETARALDGGWLHTGDLARRDEAGYLHFVARKKDIIRRRGENLSPVEVEQVLAAHPDVVEAAVIGVPSELTDEEVKAFLVLRAGAASDPEALRAWATARLAAFKLPRYVEVVDDLPHTPTGRIAKHHLPRERTAAEHDLEAGA